MGYLDYAGLQYLWGKLKEKFAPKSHTHDDRYYTESEMDGKLNSKVNNNEAGANGLLSKLSVWTATPTDDTYLMRQDTGGGNSFGRVKFSTIWSYIKSKADAIYAAKSHTHTKAQIADFPASLKNPTALTIQTNGTTAATYDGSAAKTVNVTKGNIGLGNVDNTADINKSVKYATSAGSASTATKATTADKAVVLSGFSSKSNQTWGVQTGTFVHGEYDGDGGDFAFRKNCPANGQLSMVLDGRFYQNEGKYRVLDTSDEPNLNVNSANFAKETYINQYKIINLTDLDQNTWYPVTGTSLPYNGLRYFKCSVHLNSGSKPSWSTHSGGFTAVVDILEEASGWGTTGMLGEVLINDQRFFADESKPPVGYQQMGYGSIPVWWLRGGGSYRLAADYNVTWTIQKSKYENSGQSVSPTTTYPGVSVNRSTIIANLNGTAEKAKTSEIATTGVQDYNSANRTIRIGFSGAGLTTSNLTHIAGYTEDGNKIKDVSKDVLQSWLGLGASAYKKVQSLSAVGHSDWQNQSTDDGYVPTMAFMAYWNGAYTSSGASNLQYCDRGRFGTIVTKNSGDYASAGHTHKYAGSSSAGGSANSAVKLDSNAGSSIQPVYFSGGKPVTIGYTIAKSVPADAKFTDTNTWRGIQNNLTSDSATDSLSAAQGKALKSLIDGKAASGHTHTFDSITGKPSTYTPSAHTHDDRYYTEGEVDSKLNGKSDTSHTHYSITTVADKRNDNTTPNDYRSTFIFQGLKTNSKIGSPSSDTYSYLLGLRGWNDSSGGDSHELALNDTGIYWRHGATTGWNGWNRVYTDNYHPNADNATKANSADYLNFTVGNEINFTGTPQKNTVYIGYRNTSVNEYKFNNGNGGGGLATVTAASFNGKATSAGTADSATNATNATNATTATKLSSSAGSNTQPVYFSGGKPVAIGYTIASSVPANAKFTDTTYGVATSSSNGLMSSTDKTKLDDFSKIINIQKQIKLTTDWQDTGISGNSLDTGTYVVQVSGFNSSYTYLYNEIFSGVMSWYSGDTNSLNSDEIFLHNAGHASNGNHIYLRTVRKSSGNGGLRLQIASKIAASGTDTLTFKFRRLI